MIFKFLRNQFIETIEWDEKSSDLVLWKFPIVDNAIKNGAVLTVREGQAAVFLNEGQLADVFLAGRHILVTQNLPVLTSLDAWKHGFESPFKADVLFVQYREMPQFKWGTPQPIMLRDPDFGVVRLRAFGPYTVRIISPKDFIKELVGVRASYSIEELSDNLKKMVVSKFTDCLAEMQVGVIDLATKLEELSEVVGNKLLRAFDNYGIEISNFVIENINLPDEVQKFIDDQSKMNMALKNQQKYAAWQTLQAVPGAMSNGNNMAGLSAGIAMGNVMSQMVVDSLAEGKDSTASPQTSSPSDSNQKFCSNCGKKILKTAKFCEHCGAKL